MKVWYSEEHARHAPPHEYFDGIVQHRFMEGPERVDAVVRELVSWPALWSVVRAAPLDVDEFEITVKAIRNVHDDGYIKFLESAFQEWSELQQVDDRGNILPLLPSSFPQPKSTFPSRTINGKAGFYIKDLACPVVEHTWKAAVASADVALRAAGDLAAGATAAMAVCRPPGHHAGAAFAGGYCYVNNIAVAADWLTKQGPGIKVAILDIDYHAGNGTQDIFFERVDVLTVSVHGDPAFDYPYYAGYADEIGSGPGLGYHRNFPLGPNIADDEYLVVLDQALTLVNNHSPNYVLVSAGMDIFHADPLATFNITTEGIGRIGARIGSQITAPTMFCLEGGYVTDELGHNVCALLQCFVKARSQRC
ncbi:Histone deacetylase domain-containing protein [Plasmodiophora brassicae]